MIILKSQLKQIIREEAYNLFLDWVKSKSISTYPKEDGFFKALKHIEFEDSRPRELDRLRVYLGYRRKCPNVPTNHTFPSLEIIDNYTLENNSIRSGQQDR